MFQYYRNYYDNVIGVNIRKQIGKRYIYQVVNGKQIRKRYVVPHDPRDPVVLFNRWKLAQAVLSWKAQTESTKQSYREKEPFKKIMSGYNYYIGEYMRNF